MLIFWLRNFRLDLEIFQFEESWMTNFRVKLLP